MLALLPYPLILLTLFLGASRASELRPGDVLLQPRLCYLCRLIERQEGSPYAHMAVVVRGGEDPLVAESLGEVRVLPLGDFLAQSDPARHVLIRRPVEEGPFPLEDAIQPLLGAPYDDVFLWDNYSPDGREALYCSEMVTKLMNPFLREKIPTKTMRYVHDRELWERYFGGLPPDGRPGNSPGDFERSQLFRSIGEYRGGQWSWY